MIPKILHQTTFEATWEERHLMKRAKAMMPDFEHKFWTDEANLALFEKVFPQYVDDYRNFKQGVIRVDISRCLYLHEYGGTYCDTDYRFYRPLDAEFLANRCVLGIEEKNDTFLGNLPKYGNAFMSSEKGFPLWAEFIESAFQRVRKGEERVLFIAGPHALTLFLHERKDLHDQVTFLPPETIYPDFRCMKLTTERNASTIGAHLCWGSWRNKAFVQRIKSQGRRRLSAIM
ncbi:MAG: hypothetical protein DI551_11700 [Micavibrio aeruginosavorus]|uniref:Glycosyl transferase n=1 Tax=Micavibrio aeruginosavorus TaxID=349221 RepID=A0A2W5PM98_9BACT|nr:MAG: hypothetical protein DI551_11700 [Micavibrio aeruginosavorus]